MEEETKVEETVTASADKTPDQMTIPELVALYNAKCEELEANDTGLKPVRHKRVKSFKDRKTALRRLAQLLNPEPAKAAPEKPEPETTMAKKAVKKIPKKAAKKSVPKKAAKKAKKPAKAKAKTKTGKLGVGSTPLATLFGFTAGGMREKLLLILSKRMGRQVPYKDLGTAAVKIGYLNRRIKTKKLKFKLVRVRDDSGISYGLYPK